MGILDLAPRSRQVRGADRRYDSGMTSKTQNIPVHNDDPRPEPPEAPLPSDCCGSGCIPCVYDDYYERMDEYRDTLKAWKARHPEADA